GLTCVPEWNSLRKCLATKLFVLSEIGLESRKGAMGKRFPLREMRGKARRPVRPKLPAVLEFLYANPLFPSRRQRCCPASSPDTHSRIRADRRRRGAGGAGQYAGALLRHGGARCAGLAAQLGPRLGNCRVRDVAALDADAHA